MVARRDSSASGPTRNSGRREVDALRRPSLARAKIARAGSYVAMISRQSTARATANSTALSRAFAGLFGLRAMDLRTRSTVPSGPIASKVSVRVAASEKRASETPSALRDAAPTLSAFMTLDASRSDGGGRQEEDFTSEELRDVA